MLLVQYVDARDLAIRIFQFVNLSLVPVTAKNVRRGQGVNNATEQDARLLRLMAQIGRKVLEFAR